MLKKLFKVGMVMSLMLTAMTVSAQEKQEYPRYSFNSNWALGGDIALNQQFNRGAMSFGENWRGSTNIGMDIFLQKELTYWMNMRLRLGFPNFWEPRTGMEKDANGDWQNSALYMDRHGSFSFELLFSINNAIAGYDPDRRWSLYLMAGGGLAPTHPSDPAPGWRPGTRPVRVAVLLQGFCWLSPCSWSPMGPEVALDKTGEPD